MVAPPLVSFLIAGVQKGGTTALFDYLGDYGDLALPAEKELHFFDDDEGVDWSAPDYGRYHAVFPAPDERPRGEATPIYTYWPNSLERIAAYNPAIRLIVVMRDPVQRAWSHWRMEYARGVEPHPFAWCIREGRQRLFRTEPWGHHREFSYVERGFYGEQAERLLSLFPREQLLFLRSEDLRRQAGGTLDRVRHFLGLRPAAAPPARESHVGRAADYPSDLTPGDVAHLRRIYARDGERLADLTGIRFEA
ncbi:sulfotransferase domain-containing protein [Phenylobacterium sp.]|uniref:sulfotransferase domain-containing protein n=1 Tax=Phenylobacterium sp. TaxID=1871053 RepID=UPI00301D52BC